MIVNWHPVPHPVQPGAGVPMHAGALGAPGTVPDRRLAAGESPAGLATGTVESLSLGYTKIRTEDGKLVIVPNSTMVTQVTGVGRAGYGENRPLWVAICHVFPQGSSTMARRSP